MTHEDLKATITIAEKLDWKKVPVLVVLDLIEEMVQKQQALEEEYWEDHESFGDTLRRIAGWSANDLRGLLETKSFGSWVEVNDKIEQYIDMIY